MSSHSSTNNCTRGGLFRLFVHVLLPFLHNYIATLLSKFKLDIMKYRDTISKLTANSQEQRGLTQQKHRFMRYHTSNSVQIPTKGSYELNFCQFKNAKETLLKKNVYQQEQIEVGSIPSISFGNNIGSATS